MKRFKYSLLCSAMVLASTTANAAKYEVVEVSGAPDTRYSYATGISESGDLVGISTDHFNFPIDFDHLNMDAVETDLANRKATNPDAFANVNFEDIQAQQLNADTLLYLRGYLVTNSNDARVQKVGNQTGFINYNGVSSELTLFDEVNAALGSKTRSTQDLVNDVNSDGTAVSSATAQYYFTDYLPPVTEDNPEPELLQIWHRDHINTKGVVTKGSQKLVIESPETQFGGYSFLTGISDSNYVVGLAAVSLSINGQGQVNDSCGELTDPIQLQRCGQTVLALLDQAGQPFFVERAFRWQLDDALNIIETTDLGIMFTPKEEDLRTHNSAALAVNDAGVVVGYSDGFENQSDFDNNLETREIAVYHNGTQWIEFIDQSKDQDVDSRALDINDNNMIVGYTENFVNFVTTKQMFVYNINDGTVEYPDSFFNSAESVGNAINNEGLVVGTADIEAAIGSTRRQRGFVYDTVAKELTDLNKLLSCNNSYTVVQATDINNQGVIAATALVDVPKLDSQGQPTVDSNGDPVMEAVSRAVKLIPVANGSIDDCTSTEQITYERKGAGFGLWGLLLLGAFVTIRRLVR